MILNAGYQIPGWRRGSMAAAKRNTKILDSSHQKLGSLIFDQLYSS